MTIINTTNGGGTKTVAGEEKPTSFPAEYPAPEGYDGWSKLTITTPDNLAEDNIKKGIEIAGVTGTYEPALQEKTTEPGGFPVSVTPDASYYGLSKVTLTKPENLEAENIKKDVSIAGVTGTYEPELTTEEGTITTFPMTYSTPAGYYGMSKVIAHAPDTLVAGNIKKGVEVANITGTYEPELQVITGKVESFPMTLRADADYYGLEQATVTAPDNLSAENIKKDVTIAGVTGTLEAGGLKFDVNGYVLSPTVITADMFDGAKAISNCCFYDWFRLSSIELPSTLTSIGEFSLFDCAKLTSLNIPEGVTSLGKGCFAGCSGLTSITIPEGVTKLPAYCFQSCSSLASITIPENVTSIEGACFAYCKSLTSIDLPSTLTSIKSMCFINCSALTSITIPEGVKSLEMMCFTGCTSLTSIDLPSTLTILGSNCLNNCTSLASVDIPSSLTILDNGCFMGCTSLASVTMLPTTPPTLSSTAFDNTSSSLVITVPKGCLDAYKTATNWSAYADKMVEASE